MVYQFTHCASPAPTQISSISLARLARTDVERIWVLFLFCHSPVAIAKSPSPWEHVAQGRTTHRSKALDLLFPTSTSDPPTDRY